MTSFSAAASSTDPPAWLQTLQVVPSLLWPLIALGVILLFRKQLQAKIPGLTSFKAASIEATFAIELQDLTPAGTSATDSDRRDVIGRAVRAKGYCKGKQILWVDDNPGNNRALAQFFVKLLNIRIDYVLSTAEAIDTLRHLGGYDMVITDMVRGTNFNAGIDLIRTMKMENLSVPTVIYGSKDSATEGVPAGAFGLTNRPDLLLHYLIDISERDNAI